MQDIHDDSNKEEIDLTVCPFHKCKLAIFQAESNGETYMKCQDKKCSLFSNMNNLQDYLRTIHENVHESYFKEGDLICKCEEPVSLKISRSESNPNRPFFSCKEPKEDSCGFFQWANKPLLKKNKNVQKKKPPKLQRTMLRSMYSCMSRLQFNHRWGWLCIVLDFLRLRPTQLHDEKRKLNNNNKM